jgi:hypothetical protein
MRDLTSFIVHQLHRAPDGRFDLDRQGEARLLAGFRSALLGPDASAAYRSVLLTISLLKTKGQVGASEGVARVLGQVRGELGLDGRARRAAAFLGGAAPRTLAKWTPAKPGATLSPIPRVVRA